MVQDRTLGLGGNDSIYLTTSHQHPGNAHIVLDFKEKSKWVMFDSQENCIVFFDLLIHGLKVPNFSKKSSVFAFGKGMLDFIFFFFCDFEEKTKLSLT